MFVFWWTGKGYLTALIILATLTAFGVVLLLLPSYVDGRLYWGSALLTASVLNWLTGQKANRVRRSKVRNSRLRDRLLYNAHHRFMSVPMETFSIAIVLAATIVAASALMGN